MSKISVYTICVLLALSLVQCTKDRAPSNNFGASQDCISSNTSLFALYTNTEIDTFQPPMNPYQEYIILDTAKKLTIGLGAVGFNPNNSNQILYSWQNLNNIGVIENLSVFDCCTGTSKFITTTFLGGANWSVKNWILFEGTDYNVWKIKSNGDSLTRLTNGIGSQHSDAIWNPDGTKFIYSEENSGIHFICDINGNVLNSIPISKIPYYCTSLWSGNDTLIFTGQSTIYIYSLKDSAVKFSMRIPVYWGGNKIGDCYAAVFDRIDNSTVLISDNASIYKYNFETGQKTILRKGGDNRMFVNVYANNNKTKIVTTQGDLQHWNGDTLLNVFGGGGARIFIMNSDGSNQQWVKIPQN